MVHVDWLHRHNTVARAGFDRGCLSGGGLVCAPSFLPSWVFWLLDFLCAVRCMCAFRLLTGATVEPPRAACRGLAAATATRRRTRRAASASARVRADDLIISSSAVCAPSRLRLSGPILSLLCLLLHRCGCRPGPDRDLAARPRPMRAARVRKRVLRPKRGAINLNI
ncbi:hypothetical protein DFH11DRAFT_931284 [Phellopilus nigrolimitatus]|nr:hypothetical protein DFH11DRAFT_931284 [Phellopilus nigrolimitatus]